MKYKPIPCSVINAPIVTKTIYGLISTPLIKVKKIVDSIMRLKLYPHV
jgi:hypothetical protein